MAPKEGAGVSPAPVKQPMGEGDEGASGTRKAPDLLEFLGSREDARERIRPLVASAIAWVVLARYDLRKTRRSLFLSAASLRLCRACLGKMITFWHLMARNRFRLSHREAGVERGSIGQRHPHRAVLGCAVATKCGCRIIRATVAVRGPTRRP